MVTPDILISNKHLNIDVIGGNSEDDAVETVEHSAMAGENVARIFDLQRPLQ